jgi:N-methylhydantoinase A/oxoprolinase/acetone carboxylase beta subunit
VEIQVANAEMSPPPEFIEAVKTAVIEKIAIEVLQKLILEKVGERRMGDVGTALMNNMVRGTGRRDFAVKLELNKPIIGIGALVGAYLPGVAERFHTDLVLPQHSEIGNAAGAISGNVMETVEMLIKPKKGMGTMDNPPCTLFCMQERKDFENLNDAIAYACTEGSRLAIERSLSAGADAVEVVVDKSRREARLEKGWGGNVLIELNITITGVGKTRLFFEGKR